MLIVPKQIPSGVVVTIVPQGEQGQLECQVCGLVGELAATSELEERKLWHLQQHDGARTIQIELTAAELEHLKERATEWGMDPEQLVIEVLQRMIQPATTPTPTTPASCLEAVS